MEKNKVGDFGMSEFLGQGAIVSAAISCGILKQPCHRMGKVAAHTQHFTVFQGAPV